MALGEVTFQRVALAFQQKDEQFLKVAQEALKEKVISLTFLSATQLGSNLANLNFHRDVGAQPYVPLFLKEVKKVVAIG